MPRGRSTRLPPRLRVLLAGGSLVLLVGVFLLTNILVGQLKRQTEDLSRWVAQFCADASFPASADTTIAPIFRNLVSKVRFPMVITDELNRPRAWKGIRVDANAVTPEEINRVGTTDLPMRVRAVLSQVSEEARRLDRLHPPFAMRDPASKRIIGYMHYGDPTALQSLRWIAVAEVVAILVFVGLGYWLLRSVRIHEQRSIYVGMARETAHQLGTPLSSLGGWLELLRERTAREAGPEVRLPAESFRETLEEMQNDADRLNMVAARFSRVGSEPILTYQDVVPIVREAVLYFRKRLPQQSTRVRLTEQYEEVPPVNVNRELLSWAVENLLNNALNASGPGDGRVDVTVRRRRQREAVEIEVRDHGRGMTAYERERAFEPGFTTRKRGWGLGLTLVRRIVEEYHGGRVDIAQTEAGKGTAFVISFPT
ncbi:MAG TPA: HAMP domain-containing sensor histidine kinase [Candidatus Saccharimonadales bacterium]|nr:HAMP domain-containing sensor histidine kinase [Candidatus Saccharimonadales bacterium]